MSAQHLEDGIRQGGATPSIVSTAMLRQVLQAALVQDADLDAYCLDHFPAVYSEFTLGMTRTAKLNVLLSLVSPADILARLRESHPAVVAVYLGHGLPTSNRAHHERQPSLLAPHERRNRSRMIEKVRKFWIEGVLENSLHGAVLMELEKEYRPDAVAYPWEMVLARPDTGPQRIPKSTTMLDLFEANLGELLVLGDPGTGKTTMLLDLCRDLLHRAEQDEAEPIPIVFNLSSWAQNRLVFGEWLIDELNRRYDVPRTVAEKWLNDNQFILMLDGLDEVDNVHRKNCIATINLFRREHGFTKLAICCRYDDYAANQTKLAVNTAIYLRSLTPGDVQEYLRSFGGQLRPLMALLDEHPELLETIQTPFLINVLLAAREHLGETLANNCSTEQARKTIFLLFIRASLSHKSPKYSIDKSVRYLRWLARRLSERWQTTWSLEEMQPSLLEKRNQSRYNSWARMSWIGCLAGFVLSLFLVMKFLRSENNFVIENVPKIIIVATICIGCGWWIGGMFTGIFRDMLGVLLGGSFDMELRPIYNLRWSLLRIKKNRHIIWQSMRRSLIGAGVIYVMIISLITYFMVIGPEDFTFSRYANALLMATAIGIVAVLQYMGVAAFLSALRLGLLQEEISAVAEQRRGLNASFKVFVAVMGGSLMFITAATYGIRDGRFIIIGFAWIFPCALTNVLGGYFWLRHYLLRLFLTLQRDLPFRLGRFLDYASDRMLLRRVGSSYMFIHRLLMEFFSSLTDDDIQRLAAETVPRKSLPSRFSPRQ